jgi:hypothetical protein
MIHSELAEQIAGTILMLAGLVWLLIAMPNYGWQ